ncbi:MAG: hypothetical protein MUF50_00760 [Planctomycetes bacterium]|jgi:hypothetical protein|nr:hypothetical protein [Planctomycetota bacterium]
MKPKTAFIILGIIILAALVLRIITKEDNWICQNGEWVKHGNPDTEKPSQVCSE